MVAGDCRQRGCEFIFADAEHVEDAVQKLRAHYRMEHPTKAFYELNALEDVESFNMTLDEHIGRYTGIPNWREMADGLQPRHVVNACQQIVRHQRGHPTLIDEAIALAREHGTEIPDPRVDRAGGADPPARGVMLPGDVEVQFADEMEEPF